MRRAGGLNQGDGIGLGMVRAAWGETPWVHVMGSGKTTTRIYFWESGEADNRNGKGGRETVVRRVSGGAMRKVRWVRGGVGVQNQTCSITNQSLCCSLPKNFFTSTCHSDGLNMRAKRRKAMHHHDD